MTTPAHFDLAFDALMLFYIGAFILGICWLIVRVKKPHAHSALVAEPANFTQMVEEIVAKTLASRGETAEPEVPVISAGVDAAKASADAIFDGDIQLIAPAPKNPFAQQTREVMHMMQKGDEFVVNTDVIVKMFIVNASNEKQYIRDICGSMRVNGRRVDLVRQANFDAFEMNDTDYEYCLDPTPAAPHILLAHRAETLNPIAPSFPLEMGQRKPIEGWVRFLAKEVDYQKIETNSYEFWVEDSLGRHHSITRPSDKRVNGTVAVRRKSYQ